MPPQAPTSAPRPPGEKLGRQVGRPENSGKAGFPLFLLTAGIYFLILPPVVAACRKARGPAARGVP